MSLLIPTGVITPLAIEKCKKECNLAYKNILVQGFCPPKIKITQFADGFHLNLFIFSDVLIVFRSGTLLAWMILFTSVMMHINNNSLSPWRAE